MIIAFISLVFIILSFGFSVLTFQINGINRAVISTPISIFESCIVLDSENPYFRKKELEEKLTYYYDVSISKYTADYSIKYRYYQGRLMAICMSENCGIVEAKITATVAFGNKIERQMTYRIQNDYE